MQRVQEKAFETFSGIKNVNDRFKIFIENFKENERQIAHKFKHMSIVYDDDFDDKDLNLNKVTESPSKKKKD